MDRRHPNNLPVASPARTLVTSNRPRRTEAAMRRPSRNMVKGSSRLSRVADWSVDPEILSGIQWQSDAYAYYRAIGQIRKVEASKANTMSACRLRLKQINPETGDPEETDDPAALRVWDSFVGPRGGKRELMRKYALLLDIGGEAFLIGVPNMDARETLRAEQAGDSPHLTWEFVSRAEIRGDRPDLAGRKNRGLQRDAAGVMAVQSRPIPPTAFIARDWTPDPQYTELPDSAMRSVIPDAEEYVKLRDVVSGAIRQRMAAGLLLVPGDASFGAFDDTLEEEGQADDESDPLLVDLETHMGAPILNRRDSAGYVPLIMMGDSEDLREVRLVDLSFGNKNIEWATPLREEKLLMIGQTLDAPPEAITGKGDLNHWCVTADHEVLTRHRGWVTHDRLSVGDVVRTLNHETGLAEWCEVDDMYRADVVDEPMISIEGDRHSSVTTPNHRWPVLHGRADVRYSNRTWTTSENLAPLDSFVVAAPSADVPNEQKWSDAWVELAAWLYTEGNIRYRDGRRSPQVKIWQSHDVNGDNVVRIRRAITAVFGEPVVSFGHGAATNLRPLWREAIRPDRGSMTEFVLNSAAADVVAGLFVDPAEKVLDSQIVREMTAGQLELFLDVSLRADGHVGPSDTGYLAQSSRARLDAPELAATLSGRSTSVYLEQSGMWMLSISRKTVFPLVGKNVTDTTYTGTIWCPVTRNKTWLARRNGKTFYTGNTGYSVDQELASKWVIPRGEQMAQFVTDEYLRPMLEEYENFSEQDASQFMVVFDASNITARADKGVTAIRLYDRRLLSGIATVQANGFTDDDMPSEEETAARFLMDLALRDPTVLTDTGVAAALGLDRLGIDLDALADALTPGPDQKALSPIGELPDGDQPDTGAGPDEVGEGDPSTDDPQSGGGDVPIQAPDGAPTGGASLDRLVRDLALIADGAAETGLQRACSRLLNLAQKKGSDPAVRDRLAGKPKDQVLILTGDEDLRRLGTTPEALTDGMWDGFVSRATLMVSRVLSERNGTAQRNVGRETAHIVDELVSRLQMQVLDSAGDRRYNGLLVDEALIRETLETELGLVPV